MRLELLAKGDDMSGKSHRDTFDEDRFFADFKAYCKRNNYTLKDADEAMDFGASTCTKVMNHYYTLTLRTACIMADFADLTVDGYILSHATVQL